MFNASCLLIFMCIISIIKSNGAYNLTYDKITLKPGEIKYIYSPGYTTNGYTPGNTYRWTIESIVPITINCEISIIPWPDTLTVKKTETETGLQYYGRSSFSVKSWTNKIILILTSDVRSTGGRFWCNAVTKCLCGWKYPMKITDGQETRINEFPMMAALFEVNYITWERKLFCGATIINNRQVITAAHCLLNKQNKIIQVLVGDHNLNQVHETNASYLYTVRSQIMHPDYNRNTHVNDIAILNIEQVMTFHQRVGLTCLPFRYRTDLFVGQEVTILGWGTTDFNGAMSPFLQKANVQVTSNENCSRFHSGVIGYQMCTVHPTKDSCQGDSGGPILWHDSVSKRLFLVGIISVGGICADGRPVMNTRVTSYVDWIEANIIPETVGYCKNP